jgi:hypothetical protein
MKNNTQYKIQTSVIAWCCITLLMAALLHSNKASATIINSTFENGFTGWQGQVDIFDGVSEAFFVDVDNIADFPNSFKRNTNGVTLTTAIEDINEVFGVYLFQPFTASSTAESLSLSFNASADFFQVALFDASLNLLHDFNLHGLIADLTRYRNQVLFLEFAVGDEDFILGDTLSVSDIQIKSTSVSEPTTLFISLLALMAMFVFQLTRRSRQLSLVEPLNA